MLKDYDVVILKQSIEDAPVPLGTKGTIVFVHDSMPPAFEVEFINDLGETIGVYTVREDHLDLHNTT